MKSSTLCALIGVLLTTVAFAGRGEKVADRVYGEYSRGEAFATAAPFLLDDNQSTKRAMEVNRATWLQLDRARLAALRSDAPRSLSLNLPTNDGEIFLDVVRAKVVTADFKVTTSDGETVPYQDGLHYRGIISGREDTVVALSVFEDEVMAVISTPDEGELVLGRYGNGDQHIFYSTHQMKKELEFTCGTEEPDNYYQEVARLMNQAEHVSSVANRCVEVYFECDYAMYQEKGGTSGTVNFVTGMYNVVAAIYQNEGIDTVIDQVYVWTSQDNYSTSSSSSALNQFRGRSHSADLAHLLARGASGLGGVAWLNGLCNSYGYAYSNINSSYSNLPTYSWTVGVVAHEMGHNLGSPHTHSCSWSGGALDNCYTTEGSCSPGPAPPSSGGTIMSYCHLTSYGIDLTSGFGTQPGNLIRNSVNSASCTSACGGGGGTCSGTTYNGSLSGTGSVQYQPNGTYYYTGSSGTHSGTLTGPSGTDFDLYLWKWINGSWQEVAKSTSPSSNETINYNGSAGYYTWRVYSYSGSGSYSLCLDTP